MRVSTKEDLYGFLDSFEESIRTEYMGEYLEDVFLDYYYDFKRLSFNEQDDVVDYLSTTYIDEYPEYALALSLLKPLRNDNAFKSFLVAITNKHDKLASYEDGFDEEVEDTTLLWVTNSTYDLLNELEPNVTKRLLNLLHSFNFDYNIIFEDWATVDYILDEQDPDLIDAVYNLICKFNDHSSDHYLYTYNETGLYFSNLIKNVRSKLSPKDLSIIKWANTNSLITEFGLSKSIVDDIRRDIITEFSLNIDTDVNICIILIGIILECLQIDMDFDRCYEDHSLLSLYDYIIYNYSAIEYAINLDK